MSNSWTSDRRLWLDKDGQVVEDGDPAAERFLVGVGQELDESVAREHGLLGDVPSTDEKALPGPAATKAEAKPAATKGVKAAKRARK